MRITLTCGVTGKSATPSPQVKWAVPTCWVLGECALCHAARPSASIRHSRAVRWGVAKAELGEERWAGPDAASLVLRAVPGAPETLRHRDGDCKGCWTRVAQLCTLQLEVPQGLP